MQPTCSVISTEKGERLVALVGRSAGWSEGRARAAIEAGSVHIDGRRETRPTLRLVAGLRVVVWPPATERAAIDGGALRIVHEGRGLVVTLKPAGLPTQRGPRGGDSLEERLADHLRARPLVIHRLDRDASGLCAFATDKGAARRLSRAFRKRSARRAYTAIVRTGTAPVAGTIDEPLLRNHSGGVSVDTTGDPACTEIRPQRFIPESSVAVVELLLRSGRLHQARAHLAWAVGAIVGDGRYGDIAPGPRIALHCHALSLDGLTFDARPDDAFWALAPATADCR